MFGKNKRQLEKLEAIVKSQQNKISYLEIYIYNISKTLDNHLIMIDSFKIDHTTSKEITETLDMFTQRLIDLAVFEEKINKILEGYQKVIDKARSSIEMLVSLDCLKQLLKT